MYHIILEITMQSQYINMILRDYDYYISTIIDNSNQVNDWILIEEFKR